MTTCDHDNYNGVTMAENPKVIVLSEQLRGQSFELTETRYDVGRHEDCAICIPDPTVSNHHCTLLKENGDSGYTVKDEGSTNGTRVNGVRLQSGDQQKLVNSDILQVGAIEMLYDSEEQGDASAASTRTGINLQSTAGTTSISDVPNFSPFGENKESWRKKKTFAALCIKGAVVLLVFAVLVIIAVLLYKLLTVV
ncbi:MAG: FHA domain-containing protein [Candidatus Pacebacteria bacterium]|nr:FHA domain-containing protein [Candidatus Paceibacterota bacterium]